MIFKAGPRLSHPYPTSRIAKKKFPSLAKEGWMTRQRQTGWFVVLQQPATNDSRNFAQRKPLRLRQAQPPPLRAEEELKLSPTTFNKQLRKGVQVQDIGTKKGSGHG